MSPNQLASIRQSAAEVDRIIGNWGRGPDGLVRALTALKIDCESLPADHPFRVRVEAAIKRFYGDDEGQGWRMLRFAP